MRTLAISPRILAAAVSTRAALAFGIALLVADRIPASRRRAVALSLIGFGAVTTLPIARRILGGRRSTESEAPVVTRTEIYAQMDYDPPPI
jgi:hypothetical protein